MLPPMLEVEAADASPGDPEPSTEEAAAGGGRDEVLLDMGEALDGLEGTGNGSDEDVSSKSSISSNISATSAYI